MRLTIKAAGQAGQGVESGGAGFTKALMRAGLHVYGFGDYMSRIRGGHNFFILTLDDTHEVYSNSEPIYILIAIGPDALNEHLDEVIPGGCVLLDNDFPVTSEQEKYINEKKIHLCKLPISKIANEIGGNKMYSNTALLGAAAALLKLDFKYLDEVIRQNFARKSSEVADRNSKVALEAYNLTKEKYLQFFQWKVNYKTHTKQRMLIHGNDCISVGAFSAGCRFISAYPMTPATTIIEWFARHHKFGVVTKHVEDEIAAACMAIGANFAGVRGMTATSGGGFCLMVEALGLAGMTEVPLVVVDAQRGGPSTGLPTRNEQADLLFAIHASHGEFPRIVLAPGTHKDCFSQGARAFNLAEKYQTPVIIMQDLQQAGAFNDVDADQFNLDNIKIDRGKFLTKEELDKITDPYKRFKFSEDGISPRAVPGHPKAVYAPVTDEHDEFGHITEEKNNRIKMHAKRMKKEETAVKSDIKLPEIYGPDNADITLICWGGNFGVCKDTVDLNNRNELTSGFKNDGRGKNGSIGKLNVLYFQDMWPLNKQGTIAILSKIKKPVLLESNYSGQLGKLLMMTTGFEIKDKILRYDGRSFYPEEIRRELEKLI